MRLLALFTLLLPFSLTFSLSLPAPRSPALTNRNASPNPPATPALPFNLEYIFTATLSFGPPSISPVPLLGDCGLSIPVPVLNGTVSGPGLSGVILGGTGGVDVYLNGALEIPRITAYGKLDSAAEDEGFFTVREEGIATDMVHATRLFLDISGQEYEDWRNGYILARVNRSMTETGSTLVAEAWLVTDA